MKANITLIECHWQRMQGAERRRAGFCFPLMDQVVLPFFFICLSVAVSAVYHVMFHSFGTAQLMRISLTLHGLLYLALCYVRNNEAFQSAMVSLYQTFRLLLMSKLSAILYVTN